MRTFVLILTLPILFSCKENLSQQERLELENMNHVLSINSCDSLQADSIYIANAEILIDSTTRVPNTIIGAMQILDSTTNKYAKHMFANCPPIKFHFSFGMWMRNNWGLWANGQLAKEIQRTFSIDHPDSMSGILLRLNSACCSPDEKRITEFFDFYRLNFQDSTSLSKLNALEIEIKKWKEANQVDDSDSNS